MQIVVAAKISEANKVKGDLLESLAGHLLRAQHYEVSDNKRNLRTTGVEIDLECRHKTIKAQEIYVECKAYNENKKIQSQVVTSLIGIRELKNYKQAWLISTSQIGSDAKGIIAQLENGQNADKFAFYTPDRLIDALVNASVIVSEEICRQSVINVVQDPKKLGDVCMFVSRYGYFWVYKFLKGGEPSGVVFVDAKDGQPVIDADLLENLAGLESELKVFNHGVLLDLLAITNDQVKLDDIKSLKLSALYLNEINDLGVKINHPKIQSLTLSDVKVFPDLEELDGEDKKVTDSSLLAQGDKRRAIIFGNDLSGKTTLGKFVQQQLDENGHIALMISASEVKNYSEDKFKELLKRKFLHQYGDIALKTEMFIDALNDKDSKVSLVIDNFENFGIKRNERQSAFFKYIKQEYASIIILADTSIELEALAKGGTREMLDGFETHKILQLGHVKRDELIKKWINAGNDEALTDDDVVGIKLDISNKVNIAVGANFIPTYPFYVLTMIHLIEDGNKARTQGSSYADLYNYFITHALLESGIEPEDLDFYLTYLSYFAYTLLVGDTKSLTETALQDYYESYAEKMAIDKPFSSVHRVLVNAKLLKFDDHSYSFSLSYCKYYFTAKYLSDNLDDQSIQQVVHEISQELHKNENANIVIFLVHHSKSKAIISAVIEQAKSQFRDAIPQTLSKPEMKKINGLIHEEIKFALQETTPEENRQKELTQKDTYERKKGDSGDGTDILDIFGQVNLAFKTIDVLGQIANNYYGSLDAKSKSDIITELYTLGLRGLKAFLDNFDNYIEALRQYLEEQTEKKALQSDVEKNNEIDKIIYGFVQLISFAFLKRVSDSTSSKNLIPTLNKVVKEQSGPAASIVDVAARLNFPGELSKNKKKVEVLYHELDKNYLPRDLLKMFVIQHMYKFNLSFQDKQSICAQLGINYAKVTKSKKRIS